MVIVCLIPVVLSALLMAAHFLRAGSVLLVLACLSVPLLLLTKRWWAARVVQVLLLLGAGAWVRTMLTIVGERQRNGEPFKGVVYILGSVALFTALSALVFLLPPLRRRYGASLRHAEP